MKKVLLIIFLFIFLSSNNVYASERSFQGSEYLPNIYYKKYNGEITQYRRAQVIRDTITGEIAYCVEPFDLLRNYSYYDESSYYDPIYGINEDIWEKLKLYAYYGFGYKTHGAQEWINITQMSIWRTLFPNYQFEWIDNLDNHQEVYGFNKEVEELNTLVNNHYTLPSINKEYIVSVNDTLEINDTNNVLNNYVIKKSDFEAKIENGKLIVNAGDKEKEGTILLERGSEVFNETVKYFYSTSSQNVMERGNIEPVKFEVKIKITTGKIIINKVDDETKEKTPQGEGSLDGSIFILMDNNKKILKELEIKDNTLEFDNLSFGKYYIKEQKSGTGYYLNKEEYEVVIDENNLEQKITIANKVIKSKIKITKFYGTLEDYQNGTMRRESNIAFVFYDKDRNVVFSGVTNSEGEITVDLPFGEYEVEQVNTTSGYYKVENFKITINENNNISYEMSLNDYKIDVPNASVGMVKTISNIVKEQICLKCICS